MRRLRVAFGPGYGAGVTSFTRSLWPERVRHPYLRLAAAVVAAPLLLAGMLTGIAFLIAGSSVATREATLVRTTDAAWAFFTFLPGFTLTFGLAGIGVLWWRALRGRLAWTLGGAGAGLVAPIAIGLAGGVEISPVQLAVAAVLGALIFLLIRGLAGIRLSAGAAAAPVPTADAGPAPRA